MSYLMSAGIRISFRLVPPEDTWGQRVAAPVLEGNNFKTKVKEAEAYIQTTQESSEQTEERLAKKNELHFDN